MKKMPEKEVLAAIIIGAAIVTGSFVFGTFFYASKTAGNTVKVTGSATKKISSDIAKLSMTLSMTVPENSVKNAQARMMEDVELLKSKLKAKGITENKIKIWPLAVNKSYDYDRSKGPSMYMLSQTVVVTSGELAKIEEMALNTRDLSVNYAILQGLETQFLVSDLTLIKRELIAEATRDAMARAVEMAKKSGLNIGKMVSAKAGVIQIKAPDSVEVSDYGIYSTSTIEKDITVTVNAEFALK